MTKRVTSYSISKIKKLIDLNHDMINFKVSFSLHSELPFYMVIINQNTLDNTETDKLQYHYVEKYISGDIVSDKNIYQNYYIVLKADNPTVVVVNLTTTKLPDVIVPERPNDDIEYKPRHKNTRSKRSNTKDLRRKDEKSNYLSYIFFAIICLFVIIGVISYKKTISNTQCNDSVKSLLQKLKTNYKIE